MSRDLQNVVGGILLIVCLGGLQWFAAKNGTSIGPRFPFGNGWANRETEPFKFWYNIVFYGVVMLVFLFVVIGSLSHLTEP